MIVVAMQYVVRLESRRSYNKVGTSLVKSYGVKRSKYTDIGHYRRIVVVPTVTLRRYIDNKAHMEVWLILEHRNGIFGNLIIETLKR